jgi:hypothetical protein
MQAGDGDAGIARDPLHLRAPRGRKPVRLLIQRERRDLDPVVADDARELALAREIEPGNHLIAQRNAHRRPRRYL